MSNRRNNNRGCSPDGLTSRDMHDRLVRLAIEQGKAKKRKPDTTTHAPRDGSDDPARSGVATRSAVFAVRPGGAF